MTGIWYVGTGPGTWTLSAAELLKEEEEKLKKEAECKEAEESAKKA